VAIASVYPRGIDKYYLGIPKVLNPPDPVSCCLGFFRDYCHLLAEQSIEERGFAHIGPADDGYETGLERHKIKIALREDGVKEETSVTHH
jgi:hypothetical protein